LTHILILKSPENWNISLVPHNPDN